MVRLFAPERPVEGARASGVAGRQAPAQPDTVRLRRGARPREVPIPAAGRSGSGTGPGRWFGRGEGTGGPMANGSRRSALTLACGLALALGGVGCALGPKALRHTHGPYNESVRCVYGEQLLRNLVHVRYNEDPLNLDVSSIAAQYELTGQAEARPF